MKKVFLLVAISLLFISCGGSKKTITVNKPKEMPSWYLNPPASASTLVGTGAGADRDDAVNSALTDMLSKLSVNIESTMESETKAGTSGYSQESRQKIKSEIAKIRVVGYETKAIEQISYNRFVAMIEVDRAVFAKSLASELDEKFGSVEKSVASASSDHALLRYKVAQKTSDELASLLPNILVLESLNAGYDAKKYHQKLNNSKANSTKAKQNILFVIPNSDANSNKMLEPIKAALAKDGFKIAASGAKKDGNFVVNLSSRVEDSQTSGFVVVNVYVTTKVTDHKNSEVGSNRIDLKGTTAAQRGRNVAYENAINEMSKKVADLGVMRILGID